MVAMNWLMAPVRASADAKTAHNVHRRQNDGTWSEETIEEFEVAIPLPSLATSITLNEIYDGLAR